MNWVAEGVNVLGQGAFMAGVLLLAKNGLAELSLRTSEMGTRVDSLRKGWIGATLCVMIEEVCLVIRKASRIIKRNLLHFVLDSPLKGSIYTPSREIKMEDCV